MDSKAESPLGTSRCTRDTGRTCVEEPEEMDNLLVAARAIPGTNELLVPVLDLLSSQGVTVVDNRGLFLIVEAFRWRSGLVFARGGIPGSAEGGQTPTVSPRPR